MKIDFSIKGREKYLSLICHDTHFKFEQSDASFARQTLLQSIIWKFKPQDTYCHLDGYDADMIHQFDFGFILVGRVWLLDRNQFGSQVHTAMAIEFDQESQTIKRGRFWASHMPVIKGIDPPSYTIPPVRRLFSRAGELGRGWQIMFTRPVASWAHNPSFDLSVFLDREDHSHLI